MSVNYRPISNLLLCKVLGKVVATKLLDHLQRNSLWVLELISAEKEHLLKLLKFLSKLETMDFFLYLFHWASTGLEGWH